MWVEGCGFRVQGLGFRVWVSGFRTVPTWVHTFAGDGSRRIALWPPHPPPPPVVTLKLGPQVFLLLLSNLGPKFNKEPLPSEEGTTHNVSCCYLNAKARIWAGLSHAWHIRSTPAVESGSYLRLIDFCISRL